jgi:hypothetical protein
VAWGELANTTENYNAVTPTWSNDGVDIAYVSTDLSSTDGHPDWTANTADIRVLKYDRQNLANASVPLAGASDTAFLEYYPEYSVDDAFIAFTRAPSPTPTGDGQRRCKPDQDPQGNVSTCAPLPPNIENPDGPYYNRNGEIYIVPRVGGEPTRLVANDPVSCTGETSRGSINSWPKWSPGTRTPEGLAVADKANGKTYYFLIFSSARKYPGAFELPKTKLTPNVLNKSSQLYMAPIVVDDATQAITTYPAVYLWNQNVLVDVATGTSSVGNTSNLTPAWDNFSIPPVPPVFEPPR